MSIDLVEIIKENPGCIAQIDNDMWVILKSNTPPQDLNDDALEEWWDEQTLVSSDDDIIHRGSGYGSGNCFGGDILQALASIVGIKIESV
jgi:hypothetical protein